MPLSERLQGFSADPQTLVDTIWILLRQNQGTVAFDNVQIVAVQEREVHVIRYDVLEPQSRLPPNHWWEPIEALLYGAKYLGTLGEVSWLRRGHSVIRKVPSEDPGLNGVWRISFVAIGSIGLDPRQRQGVEQRVDRLPISEFLTTYRPATEEDPPDAQVEDLPIEPLQPQVPEPTLESSRTSLWQLLTPETPLL